MIFLLLSALLCGCAAGDPKNRSELPAQTESAARSNAAEPEETKASEEKEMKKTIRVLFIGNSYTYCNDLPSIFQTMCVEKGITAFVDSVTAGGYTLAHFVSETNEYGIKARGLLKSKKYDYVVLQEQSVRPASNPETFYKSLRELLPLIAENGATPVLYETWGRADGSETLASNGWTHEEMQEKLREAYETAAEEYGTLLALAGERFHKAYRGGEEVFAQDGSHPSPLGSRICAQAIFETIAEHAGFGAE